MIQKHAVSNTVLSFSALALILTAGIVAAGPLTPPVGSVTSTYKTLTEVEPRIAINAINTPGDASNIFKITQPGSYYLTGNITGVANKFGISILASGVTLDLNGFEVAGVPGSFVGILSNSVSLKNIVIRNGMVRSWGQNGVDLSTHGATNCAVINVVVTDNTNNGISLYRDGSATGCTVSGNGGDGITAASFACMVTGCTVFSNGGDGISVTIGCRVDDCVSYSNDLMGINAGNGTTIEGCTASTNTMSGINAGLGCTITKCSVSYNTIDGIRNTSGGCTVRDCTAVSNTGNGILMAAGSTVSDNTCTGNGLDGVNVSSRSIVSNNTCASNGTSAAGGAGIHITGSRTRVEGNHCALGNKGIVVDGGTNMVIRNTCTGNSTNWTIAIGNSVAPIIQAGTNAAAISGNTFAGSLGSTESNANFTY